MIQGRSFRVVLITVILDITSLTKEGLGVRIAHLTCLEVSKQPGELQQTQVRPRNKKLRKRGHCPLDRLADQHIDNMIIS